MQRGASAAAREQWRAAGGLPGVTGDYRVCTALSLDGFTARCLVCYKALANMGCMATRRLKLMLIKT